MAHHYSHYKNHPSLNNNTSEHSEFIFHTRRKSHIYIISTLVSDTLQSTKKIQTDRFILPFLPLIHTHSLFLLSHLWGKYVVILFSDAKINLQTNTKTQNVSYRPVNNKGPNKPKQSLLYYKLDLMTRYPFHRTSDCCLCCNQKTRHHTTISTSKNPMKRK